MVLPEGQGSYRNGNEKNIPCQRGIHKQFTISKVRPYDVEKSTTSQKICCFINALRKVGNRIIGQLIYNFSR